MEIPIFNSFYTNCEKKIKTENLNIDLLNNLSFKNVDFNKFPVVKILKNLPHKDSLFENNEDVKNNS